MGKKIKIWCTENAAFLMAVVAVLLLAGLIASNLHYDMFPRFAAQAPRTKIFLLLLFGAGLCGLVFLAWLLYVKVIPKGKLLKTGFFTVFLYGLGYLVVFVPMVTPDESAHFVTSYKWANVILGKPTVNEDGYVYMRAEDAEFVLNDHPGAMDYERMLHSLTGKPDRTFVVCTAKKTVDVLPIVYLPQTVGIILARILNLKQVPLMLMGRLFNYLAFMALLFLTLKKTPVGHWVFLVITAFPMTMELVASYSYDAFVIGVSFYVFAYILHLSFKAEKVEKKDVAVLTLLLGILAPVKIIYAFMAFLCFLISPKKFGGTKQFIISAACVCFGMGVIYLCSRFSLTKEILSGSNTYSELMESHCYSLKELLSAPARVIGIFFYSFRFYGSLWFEEMIGERLGWLELEISRVVVMSFFGLLILAALTKEEQEGSAFTAGKRILSSFVVLFLCFMVYFAFMLGCTPAGSILVVGVQGRYFLPFLPVAVLAFAGNRRAFTGFDTRFLIFMIALLTLWTWLEGSSSATLRLVGYSVATGG